MEQKNIPFSEAMLLGLPEIKFCNSYILRRGEKCSGCLMGAALIAVNVGDAPYIHELSGRWPWLTDMHGLVCPWCPPPIWREEKAGWTWVTHFAGHYGRGEASAEEIADFLKRFEPMEETHAEENHAVQRSTIVGVAGD